MTITGLLYNIFAVLKFNHFVEFLSYLDFPITILFIVFYCILLYQSWKALDEKYRCTTPIRAVGLGFIPVFNLYWIFIAFRGLAKGFTEMLKDQNIKPPSNIIRLGTWFGCLVIASMLLSVFIPLIGAITSLASLIVLVLFYKGIIVAARSIEVTKIAATRNPTIVEA